MYLDTRDLVEIREDLKDYLLERYLEAFEEEDIDSFDDILFGEEVIQDWEDTWKEELDEIEEINDLENDVNSYSGDDFESRVTLIEETEFEEYCEEFVRDCGYIGDIPAFIENNIDWAGIADDMRIDYTEVEYQGTTYLFR